MDVQVRLDELCSAAARAFPQEGIDGVRSRVAIVRDAERRAEAYHQIWMRLQDYDLEGSLKLIEAGIEACLADAEKTDGERRAALHRWADWLRESAALRLSEITRLSPERQRAYLERGVRFIDEALTSPAAVDRADRSAAGLHCTRGRLRLALGQEADARTDFEKALELERAVCASVGDPDTISPEAGFGILLAFGFLAVARHKLGDRNAFAGYSAVVKALRDKQERYEETSEDVGEALRQLDRSLK